MRNASLVTVLLCWGCSGTGRLDAGNGHEAGSRDIRVAGDARGDGAQRDQGPVGDLMLRADSGLVIDPTKDSDGDGLPDAFETAFKLDPLKKDTDGDGIPDGAEDEDGDGLTNAQEWAAWQASGISARKPSPLHKDLLIELDYQQGYAPSSATLTEVIKAFAAVDLPNADGVPGIAVHFFIDEKDLPRQNMGEGLNERLDYLAAHGPKTLSGAHVGKMVHVILADERPGTASRGGETVASSDFPAEKAGVLIYLGNMAKIFPVCTNPAPPKVSLDEALISTFVHEVGHTLQLGHDTTVGGAVNPYNVMSTDLGECDLLKKRTRGIGNTDPSLGATEAGGGPRFSKAAAALIKLKNKISVEANKFESGNGYEM